MLLLIQTTTFTTTYRTLWLQYST